MNKQILVLVGLIGLLGWGVYDYAFSEKDNMNETSLNNRIENNDLISGVKEGNLAPEFQLQTLEGREVKLSDYKGKKVILNFWATWCPPCKAEMPHMQEFYLNQQNDNVEILAVNLTTAEKNTNDIGKFVKDYGLTFPILLDTKGDIGETYQAFTIPTSYIIDSQGIVRKKIVGPMDKEMMEQLIKSID